MAKKKSATKKAAGKKSAKADRPGVCAVPEVAARTFGPHVSVNRAQLIRRTDQKWVNGTVLHYYFFDQSADGETVFFSDGTSEWRPWTTKEDEKDVCRQAFDIWASIGIGLEFEEVSSRDEAEIRIGFMRGDGAWSYIGRHVLNIGRGQRTMNFGWDLTRRGEIDTAVHEIGHTVGFPHEHQNPNAGIVWDEEAVYAALAEPPNQWPRDKTFHNIIRKIDPDMVQGSSWDPDSIMHYPFGPGLIKQPEQFKKGIRPAPGLSARDKTWMKTLYPPLTDDDYEELKLLQSVPLAIGVGEQKNFVIRPNATREHNISTFGESDTVIVLFEDYNGEPRYLAGDDDSGEDYNASIRVKLFKGRRYVLRLRLYYAERTGETAVMMW